MKQRRPQPSGAARRDEVKQRRLKACDVSSRRPNPSVPANQEEEIYSPEVPTSFTKGLPCDKFGIVKPGVYPRFAEQLTEPLSPNNIEFDLPVGTSPSEDFRGWESPLAGHYYDLEGADADGVAMPPAPRAGRSELCAEMAEIYAMALLRDVPFTDLEDGSTKLDKRVICVDLKYPKGHPKAGKTATLQDLIDELNKLSWFDTTRETYSSQPGRGTSLTMHEQRRRAARVAGDTKLTVKNLFRGSAKGSHEGPYLSQFLLLGTEGRKGPSTSASGSVNAPTGSEHSPRDGVIVFGANTVDQRVYQNTPCVDFMTSWSQWLRVQRGVKVNVAGDTPDQWEQERRFIATPRDLATYVHFDQLYQAYFNACLMLLGNGVPFDPGFPNARPLQDSMRPHKRAPFATFGPPHILSLFTEVATRALKAVRRQKFQVHRRARPEVLAARLTMAANGDAMKLGNAAHDFQSMLNELGDADPRDDSKPGVLLYWVALMNKARNDAEGSSDDYPGHSGIQTYPDGTPKNLLLPMAFPEGSPMHAAYGAGHATVAAACVTVLKAFFTSEMFDSNGGNVSVLKKALGVDDFHVAKPVGNPKGPNSLEASGGGVDGQTLGGELDKLAANIAIGRNFAGVHYYTDYYDSVRMGERIAVSILEEQMLNYPEKVRMSFTSWDGANIDIRTVQDPKTGKWDQVEVAIDGDTGAYDSWWVRETAEYDDPSLDEILIASAMGM